MSLWFRSVPFLTLIGYYVLLVAIIVLLSHLSPTVRQAFFTPVELATTSRSDAIALLQPDTTASAAVVSTEAETLRRALERSLTTFLVIIGAILLVIPVGWVYMQTKRLRYDPALVRAVMILPIVVAGITMVVKYSIALAFALTGIVAAVRFRNTLKDPRDAVYIFLVIGIGLASGVQELDVALVMSMMFNLVMLTLWRYNIGSVYGGGYGRTGVLFTGDPTLLVAQVPEARKEIRRSLLREAEDFRSDGVLLVHADDVDLARHTVQEALSDLAKDWRLVRVAPRDDGLSTLEYLVRLKKKTSPPDLVGAVDERWSAQVCAAEYFPMRMRSPDRDEDGSKEADE
ncbi:MAG: DUF4956 domain-containing protein [Gemmatimonadetes bacterium]|nr:DUF4956 domain-containing protein [Gemmatimonadota bacterium]